MEYREILKKYVLEKRHTFIFGSQKERTEYLKSIAAESYLEDRKKTIPIYIDYSGFPDTKNTDIEKWRLISFQNAYFEFLLSSLMVEKFKTELPDEEISLLEKNLNMLFYQDNLNNFENLKNELNAGMEVYKTVYEHYIKTGEIKSDLFEDIKINFVMFDMLLPDLKQIISSFSDFVVIINKVRNFSKVYTKVINTYIASRSNGYLNMKIGCENNKDWNNYCTINGEYVEYIHDYGVVSMDDMLTRKKKINE